jgi:hypothetical protein
VKRSLFLGFILSGTLALAQADLPDAGLPDASVGGTGAERSSEEEDANLRTPCLSSNQCDRGAACIDGVCKWQRYRDATYVGCGAAPGLVVLGAVLLSIRSVRARRGSKPSGATTLGETRSDR